MQLHEKSSAYSCTGLASILQSNTAGVRRSNCCGDRSQSSIASFPALCLTCRYSALRHSSVWAISVSDCSGLVNDESLRIAFDKYYNCTSAMRTSFPAQPCFKTQSVTTILCQINSAPSRRGLAKDRGAHTALVLLLQMLLLHMNCAALFGHQDFEVSAQQSADSRIQVFVVAILDSASGHTAVLCLQMVKT